MKASDLVAQVHHRELERITTWAQNYVDWRDARLFASQAVVAMWTKATRDENTRNGPIEHMLGMLAPRIRRICEIRGSYLPVAAPFTISLPSDTELNELADAYSLVQITAGCFEIDWSMRTDVQAWLYDTIEPGSAVAPLPSLGRSIAAGGRAIALASRALDDGTALGLDAYGWREACRRRELDRSRKWLIRATMAQRGHTDVPTEEVHDLRGHGQVVAEDSLAGARTARPAEPGHDDR